MFQGREYCFFGFVFGCAALSLAVHADDHLSGEERAWRGTVGKCQRFFKKSFDEHALKCALKKKLTVQAIDWCFSPLNCYDTEENYPSSNSCSIITDAATLVHLRSKDKYCFADSLEGESSSVYFGNDVNGNYTRQLYNYYLSQYVGQSAFWHTYQYYLEGDGSCLIESKIVPFVCCCKRNHVEGSGISPKLAARFMTRLRKYDKDLSDILTGVQNYELSNKGKKDFEELKAFLKTRSTWNVSVLPMATLGDMSCVSVEEINDKGVCLSFYEDENNTHEHIRVKFGSVRTPEDAATLRTEIVQNMTLIAKCIKKVLVFFKEAGITFQFKIDGEVLVQK